MRKNGNKNKTATTAVVVYTYVFKMYMFESMCILCKHFTLTLTFSKHTYTHDNVNNFYKQ